MKPRELGHDVQLYRMYQMEAARLEKDGRFKTIADKFEGKRFNSPNDLCYKSNGDLYFTDPPYGMEKNWDDPVRELDFCGVLRVKPDNIKLQVARSAVSSIVSTEVVK